MVNICVINLYSLNFRWMESYGVILSMHTRNIVIITVVFESSFDLHMFTLLSM